MLQTTTKGLKVLLDLAESVKNKSSQTIGEMYSEMQKPENIMAAEAAYEIENNAVEYLKEVIRLREIIEKNNYK